MTTVIRPTWSAGNDRQRAAIARAVELAQRADEAEAAAWEAIVAARDLGVPDSLLCERTNRSRATLNRKFGPRRTPVTAPSPTEADE